MYQYILKIVNFLKDKLERFFMLKIKNIILFLSKSFLQKQAGVVPLHDPFCKQILVSFPSI